MSEHTWREEDSRIDRFAYDAGYHNGPVCVVCGFYYCVHCDPKAVDSECGTAPIPGDPSKLSPGVDAVRTELGLEPLAQEF